MVSVALRIVGQRHLLLPELRNDGVESNVARIAGTRGADSRLISDTADRDRPGVQIVRDFAGAFPDLDDSRAHQRGGDGPLVDRGLGEAKAFIIEEEIGPAAEHLREHWPAKSGSKPVRMRDWQRRIR